MAPSQEDELEQMIHQDPHSGLIAGDPGHGTMTVTKENELMEETEELTGAVGGIKESTSAEYLSDIKWKEDNPLFVFDNDNVMKPQTPTTTSFPIQVHEEGTVSTSGESPLRKKPCFRETTEDRLSKTNPKCLEPNYDEKELVGFTQPPLVDMIPWIRYKVQNTTELSFRQELRCIREMEHF